MNLKEFLQIEQIPFEQNIDLKKKTWIHRGGTASYFITPDTPDQLVRLVRYLYDAKKEFKIVGHTSNLYIRNTTDIAIVISTLHLHHYEEKDGVYICECGVAIAPLARQAVEKGQAGYEGLINLPGTAASAAVNNASCFQCGISDLLIEAEVLCPDGEIRTFSKDMFGYTERSSVFKRGEQQGIILQVSLDCSRKAPKEELLQKAESNTLYRKMHQEGPKQNLGSTYPIYVMKAFYAHLPRLTRLLLRIVNKIYLTFGQKRPQALVNTIILLCSGKYIRLHRYISKHNFGCFVWRDEKADEAFAIYKTFIAQTSGLPDIEIEVL